MEVHIKLSQNAVNHDRVILKSEYQPELLLAHVELMLER